VKNFVRLFQQPEISGHVGCRLRWTFAWDSFDLIMHLTGLVILREQTGNLPICQLLGHFPKKMLFDRKDGSSKDGIAICILQNISMFFFSIECSI